MVLGVLNQAFDVLVLRYGVQKRVYCNVSEDEQTDGPEEGRVVCRAGGLWRFGCRTCRLQVTHSLFSSILSPPEPSASPSTIPLFLGNQSLTCSTFGVQVSSTQHNVHELGPPENPFGMGVLAMGYLLLSILGCGFSGTRVNPAWPFLPLSLAVLETMALYPCNSTIVVFGNSQGSQTSARGSPRATHGQCHSLRHCISPLPDATSVSAGAGGISCGLDRVGGSQTE